MSGEDGRSSGRHILQLGFILLLIGLLNGLAVPALGNDRLMLSAHITAVLNAMLLILVGLVWPQFTFGRIAGTLTAWLFASGTYGVYLATLLAAVSGAAGMVPIAGGGRTGGAHEEAIVTVLLMSASAALLLACVFAIWGLRSSRK